MFLVALHSLSPYLISVTDQRLSGIRVFPQIGINAHDPKTAISGVTFQKISLIRGSAKYTLSRMSLHNFTIRRAVHIILSANICFHLFHIRSLDASKLRELNDPSASGLFHARFSLHGHEAVAEPFATHNREESGFTNSLSSGDDQAIVIFASGIHHSRYRRRKMLTCHGPVELTILRTYIIDDQSVQARNTVPFEAVQILTDRMASVLSKDRLCGILDLILSADTIDRIEIYPQIGRIRVLPSLRLLSPWQSAIDKYKAAEQIILEPARQMRIIVHDGNDVPEGWLNLSSAIIVQITHPLGIFLLLGNCALPGIL